MLRDIIDSLQLLIFDLMLLLSYQIFELIDCTMWVGERMKRRWDRLGDGRFLGGVFKSRCDL